MMKTKLEVLREAGINTEEMLTFLLSNVDTNELVRSVKEVRDQKVLNTKNAGYVDNELSHRRWVMSKMFKMLPNFNDALDSLPFNYQFTVMQNELKTLIAMERDNDDELKIRSMFFTKEVVANILEEIYNKVVNYVDALPVYEGKKYVRFVNAKYMTPRMQRISVGRISALVFAPLEMMVRKAKASCTWKESLYAVEKFYFRMVDMPDYNSWGWNIKRIKSRTFKDAYKGNGAYYVMRDLIRFHHCTFEGMNAIESERHLNTVLYQYYAETQISGWRMFGLMKDFIKKNNFDFTAAMKAKYGREYDPNYKAKQMRNYWYGR